MATSTATRTTADRKRGGASAIAMRPHLTFAQIPNMNVGFFGIQYSFGLQQSNMIRLAGVLLVCAAVAVLFVKTTRVDTASAVTPRAGAH